MFSAALQRRNTDTPNIWSTDSRVQSACFRKCLGTGLVKDCDLKSVFNCRVMDFDIYISLINWTKGCSGWNHVLHSYINHTQFSDLKYGVDWGYYIRLYLILVSSHSLWTHGKAFIIISDSLITSKAWISNLYNSSTFSVSWDQMWIICTFS
jgi:hypothetical protein